MLESREATLDCTPFYSEIMSFYANPQKSRENKARNRVIAIKKPKKRGKDGGKDAFLIPLYSIKNSVFLEKIRFESYSGS